MLRQCIVKVYALGYFPLPYYIMSIMTSYNTSVVIELHICFISTTHTRMQVYIYDALLCYI